MLEFLKKTAKAILRPTLLKRRIRRYREGWGGDFKIIFGRHWADLPGWLILSQQEQDITRRLELPSNSVDVVFTEHVIEHVEFAEGVGFMREAHRILKPGGTFRVVCPVLEKLLQFSPETGRDREYLRCLERYYPEEKALFSQLGFDGLTDFPKDFLLNSVFTGYGHRFIWSAGLMAKVLSSLGYSSVRIYEVGKGENADYCVERRRRGLYLGGDPAEDRAPGWVYDAESMAVEALK